MSRIDAPVAPTMLASIAPEASTRVLASGVPGSVPRRINPLTIVKKVNSMTIKGR